MHTKAIKDLVQLSEVDFCAEVAAGLTRVAENVNRLRADAVVLGDAGRFHGSRVLTAIAEEEASKFLILVDAVRCPRHPGERLSTQLGRFNDHLAKGLYAKACMYRPSTLGELQHYLDLDRDEYYLDGPNDCDWIFYNEIMHTREGQLYVDYIHSDEGHGWSDPGRLSELFGAPHERASVSLMRELSAVGIATPAALSTVGEIWRVAPPDFDTPWSLVREMNHRTLQTLEDRGQLIERPPEIYSRIIHHWPFPMFGLDLKMINVKIGDLRERQRRWSPES